MENLWIKYKRKGLSEMRLYIEGEDLTGISLSDADKKLDTLVGGYVARNPNNHSDQWYVSKGYHDENLEPVSLEQEKETDLFTSIDVSNIINTALDFIGEKDVDRNKLISGLIKTYDKTC